MTGGNSSNVEAIHAALAGNGVEQLEVVEVTRPVITLNHRLIIEDEFCAAEDAVPLHLDDWPSFAEPAYMRRDELAEHAEMNMYVAEDE